MAEPFNIVLYQPLIPQNTGSTARLAAATNSYLHLIEPLGFELTDRYLKRAGLDYWPEVKLTVHKSWERFLESTGCPADRLWLFTKHCSRSYLDACFAAGDFLLFGNEELGVSQELRAQYANRQLTIPMENQNVRSLNLATSVGIGLYEARRQVAR